MLFLSETICGIILLEFTKFCFHQFHYLSVINFNILLQQNKIMALQTGDKAPDYINSNPRKSSRQRQNNNFFASLK